MKRNGFTLVELLAVIALVAIFLLVTIPTVDSVIKKQKNRLYNIQLKNVTEALKTWGNMNISLLPEEDNASITVTLNDLKEAGLVEDDLANPKTDKCYLNSKAFTITKNGEGYIYIVDELIDGTSADCNVS